jgi:hypothetical protein
MVSAPGIRDRPTVCSGFLSHEVQARSTGFSDRLHGAEVDSESIRRSASLRVEVRTASWLRISGVTRPDIEPNWSVFMFLRYDCGYWELKCAVVG